MALVLVGNGFFSSFSLSYRILCCARYKNYHYLSLPALKSVEVLRRLWSVCPRSYVSEQNETELNDGARRPD